MTDQPGWYRVKVKSKRTALEYWGLVEAENQGEAEMSVYNTIRRKKSFWPEPRLCTFDAKYFGTERPDLNIHGELELIEASHEEPEEQEPDAPVMR